MFLFALSIDRSYSFVLVRLFVQSNWHNLLPYFISILFIFFRRRFFCVQQRILFYSALLSFGIRLLQFNRKRINWKQCSSTSVIVFVVFYHYFVVAHFSVAHKHTFRWTQISVHSLIAFFSFRWFSFVWNCVGEPRKHTKFRRKQLCLVRRKHEENWMAKKSKSFSNEIIFQSSKQKKGIKNDVADENHEQ